MCSNRKRNHGVTGYLLFISLLLLLPIIALGQGNFESKASGAWNTKATWRVVSGRDNDTIPDANDFVVIKTGHTVTSGNQNRDCATLTINTGGTLSIDNSGNVRINASPGSATISGTVAQSSSGSLQETGNGTRTLTLGSGGKITVGGTSALPAFDVYTFDPTSTFEYTASANQNVQSGIAYGNLTLGGTGTKTYSPIAADSTLRVYGTLSVATGVTFNMSTNVLYAKFYGDVLNNGTINSSVGIVVTEMLGAHWTNNGSYLRSLVPGYGKQPTVTFFGTQIAGTTNPQKFCDVVFEGACSASISLDSLRNVTIRPGATFSAGSGTIAFTGAWSNAGTFTANTSTVVCMDTAKQFVDATTFHNLTVNNRGGISLNGNMTTDATGVLTLTNGSVATESYTLSIDNSAPAAIVMGTNGITGAVSRAIEPGSTAGYAFLGPNAVVTPNGTGNPAQITMREFPGTFPPNLSPSADTTKIVKRYYTITQTGAGAGYSQAVQLPYLDGEVRGNEATYALFSNGGSGWVNQGSFMANPASNYVMQAGLTTFGNWAIAEGDQALPIQLAYFRARLEQSSNNVIMSWRTLSETNNYGFFVQKSSGTEGSYTDIPEAFIPGHGTTVEPHDYAWTDASLPQGVFYYRLKQMDLDGTISYSDAVRVEAGSPLSVKENVPVIFSLAQNYPNPFNPETSIEFSVDAKAYTTVTVHNILGQLIATLYADVAVAGQSYRVHFNGAELSNGIYFIALHSGEKSALRKMTLLK
jgi:hypothetical protein